MNDVDRLLADHHEMVDTVPKFRWEVKKAKVVMSRCCVICHGTTVVYLN